MTQKTIEHAWFEEIPSHWRAMKLRRLCLVKRGASPRPIDDPIYFDEAGSHGWVRISDVTASNKYLERTEQRVSDLGRSLSVSLGSGDLFLSIAGSVGKPIITRIRCCIHDGFVYFPGIRQCRDFLYYVFMSGRPFDGLGKLGTQLNLNTDTVSDIYIPLPRLDEQRIIADFLDRETAKIDDLIAKKERLIELANLKTRVLATAAVENGLNRLTPYRRTGLPWFPLTPSHWDASRVKFVTTLIVDGVHHTPEYVDDGIPFLTVRNITAGNGVSFENTKFIRPSDHAQFAKRAHPRRGDLLISKDGTLGVTRERLAEIRDRIYKTVY